MRTAIDTNVLSALWSQEPLASDIAKNLGNAKAEGARLARHLVTLRSARRPHLPQRHSDVEPTREQAWDQPQTLRAVDATSSSLRHCSSIVSRLPAATEANPHCVLMARFSSGT
jgi:hypothetical protein